MKHLRRLWCYIVGCRLNNEATCERCREYIYDHPGIYEHPCTAVMVVQKIGRKVRGITRGHTCEVCGKRYWSGRDEFCCSHECYGKWIPF